jgi:hypothetical protein
MDDTHTLPEQIRAAEGGAGALYEDGTGWHASVSVYVAGRAVNAEGRQDVAEEIARRWNACPDLLAMCEESLRVCREAQKWVLGKDWYDALAEKLVAVLAKGRP